MFERLAWICDIARFLIVTPDLDWKAMVAATRRACALRQLSLGVQLAVDLLYTTRLGTAAGRDS